MAQPNLLSEPHETHQITLSLQSQVPSTPEPILAHVNSHITINNKSLHTENKTTFPLSHKPELSNTTYFALVNHTTTPHTPVNLTNSTPEIQIEPPHDLANQTVPPPNLNNQAKFGNHDLKRKDHPDSPTSILKKSRFEDACLEVSRSQFVGTNYLVMRFHCYITMWKVMGNLFLWLRRQDCTCLLMIYEDSQLELSRDL